MKLKTSHYIFISLIITSILCPFALHSLKSMKLDTSIQQVMGTDSRTQDTYQRFNQAFQDKKAVVAIAQMDNIFSNEGAKNIYEISRALQSIPGLNEIKSLTHSARPVKGKISFDLTKMIDFKPFVDLVPKSKEDWQKIKKFTTAYPMTRDILVSADGSHALFIALPDDSIQEIDQKKELLKITKEKIQPFIDKGIPILLLSEPFLAAEFHSLVFVFLKYFISISLCLLTITIYLTFRSFKILILMLSYQVAGFLIFPPIFHLNVASINVFTFIIIPLVSALHLTFLTHFFSVFQEKSSKDSSLREILQKTLKVVLKPSLIAMLTSSIGLGALILSEISVLQTVGIVGLEALSGIFIITFLPAIILSMGKSESKDEEELPHSTETPLIQKIDKLKTPLIFGSLILGITVSCFLSNLNTDVRIKEFLDKKSETRAALNLLDEHFGGINILQLAVQTENEGGIQDYKVLQYLHSLRNEAMQLDGVLNAYTYSQFYTTIHQLFLGDNMSTGDVMPNEITALMYSKVINSINFPFQDVLQSADKKSTVFFLRTKDLPTDEFLKVIEKFGQLAKKNTPEGVEVKVSDGVHTILKSNRQIVKTQVSSLGTSLGCIFLCLLIMWRSPKLATVALLCNLIPLFIIGGLMLIFGIPVNAITVMAGSIILGISVDDSIHFLSFFKNAPAEMTLKEKLSYTLEHKLKPMICTSLILVICLLLLIMAPFTPVKDFGLIGGIAILGGLGASCILLPALTLFTKASEK